MFGKEEVFKTDRWNKIVKLLPKNSNGIGLDLGVYWPMSKKIEEITGMKILQFNLDKSQIKYGCIRDLEKIFHSKTIVLILYSWARQ